MKREVIIFVVFASFAISSVVPSTPAKHGLSEEGLASLSNIANNENTTLETTYAAISPFFDILERLVAQSIFNLPAGTGDSSPIVAKALSKAKDATDNSLDAILIAAGKSCPAIDTARVALHGILDHIYEQLSAAIASAKSAHSSENHTDIQILQAAVHTDCVNFAEKLYDPIRICQNITDNTTLAVLKSAQDKSGDSLIHIIDAIFNAIKIYGATVSAEYRNINFLFDIEHFRGRALFAARNHLEHKFSALKSMFINHHLNKNGIFSTLAADQYARTLTHNKVRKAVGLIYDSIINDLERINLGLSPDMPDDFSRDDAAKAEVIATFNAMISVALESFRYVQPLASSVIEAAETKLFEFDDQIVTSYYHAMDVAMDQSKNYTEALNEIEIYVQNTPATCEDYVGTIFNVTDNDPSWDADTVAKMTTLHRTAITAVEISVGAIFDSTKILAKAARKIGSPDEDYLAEILANRRKAIPAIITYADAISFAHINTLLAANTRGSSASSGIPTQTTPEPTPIRGGWPLGFNPGMGAGGLNMGTYPTLNMGSFPNSNMGSFPALNLSTFPALPFGQRQG